MSSTPTNILIVEDEKEIRRFVRTALESEGLRVFESETLQRGLIEAVADRTAESVEIHAPERVSITGSKSSDGNRT